MISLEKIAALAGVSRRTVARALKDKNLVRASTYDKINKIIQKYNYSPNLAARYLIVKKKNYKILFVIIQSKFSPFHAYLHQIAEQKANTIKAFGVNVDFLILNRDVGSTSLNFEQIKNDFNYDFLITLPAIENFYTKYISVLIEIAAQKNVPYLFYNMDNNQYARLCYVGCNYIKSGKIAAGLVALCTQNHGKVAIISNKVAGLASSYSERILGFKEEIKNNYPNINILYEYIMLDNSEEVDFELIKTAQINAVYLVNPGDYSLCSLLKARLGKDSIKIITNDYLAENKDLLRTGLIDATITQDPETQATLPLEIAFNYLVNNKKNVQDKNFTNLSILIQQCI